MASTSQASAVDDLPTVVSRQDVAAHDLHGLVGVETPFATEARIRESFEKMALRMFPASPSNAVSNSSNRLSGPCSQIVVPSWKSWTICHENPLVLHALRLVFTFFLRCFQPSQCPIHPFCGVCSPATSFLVWTVNLHAQSYTK